MAMNTTPKLKGATTGKFDQDWKGTDGSGHVRPLPGPVGQAHSRQLLAVDQPADPTVLANVTTASRTVTWTAAENVTEITVMAMPSAGTLAAATNLANTHGIWVVFAAPSDAVADAWLVQAEYTATDSQRYFVPYGIARTFRFTSNVLRADVITADNGIEPADLTSTIVFEAN